MEQPKYDVFISYSRDDYVDEHKNVIPGNVISIIKEKLSEHKISYWFDEEGNLTGKKFAHVIASKISESMVFLFVCSYNSVKSKWVDRELSVADDRKKHIIPFVCDDSYKENNVIMYTASLDRIEYYKNPEKELDKLITAIEKDKKELEQKIHEEEQKKQEEEERKRQEEIERRRIEEQKHIINDINIACKKLNIEEERIILDRENLILATQKVTNEAQRLELKSFIIDSSPIKKALDDKYKALGDMMRKVRTELTEQKEVLALVNDSSSPNIELDKRIRNCLVEKIQTEEFSYSNEETEQSVREIEEKLLLFVEIENEAEIALGSEEEDVPEAPIPMHYVLVFVIFWLVLAIAIRSCIVQ